MSIGFGEVDQAAAWSLEGAVIPQHRMRVNLLPESASIGEMTNVVEELNRKFSDNMRSRFAVGDWRAPIKRE